MRRSEHVCLYLLAANLFSSSAPAMAEVLPEDTTWSGTAVVETDLEVPGGVTLTVEPGTTISLGDSVSIRVAGRLLAEGTEADPIRFTRAGASGQWGRLTFVEAEDSRLVHCVIEYSDCEGDHKDYYPDDCDATGDPSPRSYHEAVVVLASHVDIENCTFQNLPDSGAGAEGDAIAVISDDPGHPGEATAAIRGCEFLSIGQGVHTRYSYVLVEDCYFTGHNGDNDDVDLYGESTPPPLIQNNLFLDPNHDDMINPTRCSAVLIGNVIAGSDDHGIVLRDRCDPVLINNVIYDCDSAGIAVQNTCDALLINNTIVDCGRGVRFFDHTGRWGPPYCLVPGSGRATLINTVIWDCPTTLTLTDSPAEANPGSHATLLYCDIQGGEGRMSVSSDSTVTWEEGNIDADPLFVDAPNGDFRLREGSPLIDAGTAEPARIPEVDLNGVTRPCGDGVDIGATEHDNCDVMPPVPFRRGDANADASVDIADPITIFFHAYRGHVVACHRSADVDDNDLVEVTDGIYLLYYLFLGGPAPLPPGPVSCALDPTPEGSITCESHDACP